MNRIRAGAYVVGEEVSFTVWAPEAQKVNLHLQGAVQGVFAMEKTGEGYFERTLHAGRHCRYLFEPDGRGPFPDPASHFQPEGVHNASQVVDHQRFQWDDDNWKGRPFEDMVLYELHVGTFTPEGTFDAIIPRLEALAALGVNAVELMPVSEFPGNRNWGYDGAYPYAVHSAYGGPEGLKALVNVAHSYGISVFLDIVLNHIGPEGNYFTQFGPYFTEEYSTPWGKAINFDGEWSDGVREYFSELIIFWSEIYHLDGLRLDAIHTIYDKGAVSFWELVQNKLSGHRQLNGRAFHMIAESDLNSPRVTKPVETGGMGFNAQWLDDFHHALYVLLDKKGKERYVDFGSVEQVAKAFKEGFVHSGSYVQFRKRRHGASSAGVPGNVFVAFNLNHDQAGNRAGGERLSQLVDIGRQKVAMAALMLSPYVPMLFMGEEYGEDTPFLYFVSHTEPDLIEKVIKGRTKDFEMFSDDRQPSNPQEEDTFLRSKINWEKRTDGKYAAMLDWTRSLIALRKTQAALRNFNKDGINVAILGPAAFLLKRTSEDERETLLCYFNLSDDLLSISLPGAVRDWGLRLDSSEDIQPQQASLQEITGPGVKVYSNS